MTQTKKHQRGAAAVNVKLSGRGLYADKLCKVKIYVKAKTSESRSVDLDSLRRLVKKLP